MNKEFRVWDFQDKTFFSEEYLKHFKVAVSYNGEHIRQDFWGGDKKIGEDVSIQQWTGALDKNNNKIFEGDIVLFDNPDPYDGEDKLTKIVGYNSRVMGFRLYNFTHEINKYSGDVFFSEQVEVIGNIFEGAVKDGVDYGLYLKAKQ